MAEDVGRAADQVVEPLPEAVGEALTMALYVSLSLLAVLLATPEPAVTENQVAEALTVLLTALGLLLAHQVAFRISSRMTHRGTLDAHAMTSLRAQSLGGLPVALGAAVPVLILGTSGLVVAELLLLAFVAVVGYRSVRVGGLSRTRSLVYVLVLAALVAGVLALKVLVHH